MVGKSLIKQRYLQKKNFYSDLIVEDITGADYMHAKRVCKDFEIKSLGKYYNFHLKSDTLLLAGIFKNFGKTLESLSFRSCKTSFSSRWAWQSALKKTGVKLESLIDVDILLMDKKGCKYWDILGCK